MIAVYARSDHPPGYGYPPREGEAGGRAHGYVVLLVTCEDQDELDRVTTRLANGWQGITAEQAQQHGYQGGQLSDWYGGKFDLVAQIIGPSEAWVGRGYSGRFASLGDNRFVGKYKAAEVLSAG